ncbi:hypothetical protein [Flaviaesturariibacter amylovorans]|uniref:DUF3072 domain-containing protein n=1 Tax=Flaviaesturariibacter amylovorans TaxID=1084520 RepID=A0ABP8GG30_9BACT
MDKQYNDPKAPGPVMPGEVLNAAQDPASMKDPLQQELEKTEGNQTEAERQTLDRLRKQYGPDGNPEP